VRDTVEEKERRGFDGHNKHNPAGGNDSEERNNIANSKSVQNEEALASKTSTWWTSQLSGIYSKHRGWYGVIICIE